MRVASDWKDYELIDASNGERLERWGQHILVRPDPQVIWKTPRTSPAPAVVSGRPLSAFLLCGRCAIRT